MSRTLYQVLLVAVVLTMVLGTAAGAAPAAQPAAAPDATVTVTIMHTNDFHGQLEPAGSAPGMARVAQKVVDVRANPASGTVLLVDAGDEMQGSLLSNMFHGESTIDIFNEMGYDVATFGNHEFDWGLNVLRERVDQANYPYVSANIVVNDTGNCATAGWTAPDFTTPYVLKTVGTAPDTAVIAFVGVTSQETPYITVASATEGLCFKDPAQSISHYWAEMKAQADAIVVLSHLGNTDGGYGYGLTVYGDGTLATRLSAAGTPVNLIIGGHSHTDLLTAQVVAGQTIVQSHYNGRKIGKATLTIDTTAHTVGVAWQRIVVNPPPPGDPQYQPIVDAINVWANDPWYQAEIRRVVGFTNVSMVRNYNGDCAVGAFVNDAIYGDLNTDDEPLNDVDMVFNNPGGLRADITIPAGATTPYTLTHGMLFNVLPFGNQTIVGDMTGAQIVELLNQSATLYKGALQVSGVRYSFYRYTDTLPPGSPGDPGANPPVPPTYYTWAWGAFNIQVKNKDTGLWESIDLDHTYRIATNEFLAPAGQDGFIPFKYVTNISYWGDMLDGVERWVAENYTKANAYSGGRDGRIDREGTDAAGAVVPVTLLFHNDPHGNLTKGTFVGWTQLSTLVTRERAHNPTRTLLFNTGDTIQGDAMSYYFKTAGLGYAADGTPLDPALQIQPAIAVMNAMNYDAMVLGNHEFNFGKDVFGSVFEDAEFPILGANLYDDGAYGLDAIPVQPHVILTLPGLDVARPINVAVLGITNHRIPNYELPSNIPGLTFTNPVAEAQARVPGLAGNNDVVVALTHIGFTENPSSVEVDTNVDTYLAAQTSGIDAILGSHSHTDPSKQTAYSGAYKYLPAIIGGADNEPVLVHQAYRYNNYVGKVVLGLLPIDTKGQVNYKVVSRAGSYEAVTSGTAEDAALVTLLQPYVNLLTAYNNTELGETNVPIDALQGFTQETNGGNLQADAAMAELESHGITPDFYLSGAMSDKKVAASATPATPVMLKVADMFSLMPYENSLVVISMNGPQLKTILERGYRNYWWYKYTPSPWGGYSHYPTCFLGTNSGNQIVYSDGYPKLPNGRNVKALIIGGVPVDFNDAATYYDVATVNYLAAGSCNFNDAGVTLWPLDQIAHDTQYYVRDAVIHYVADVTPPPIAPAIEGRLVFDPAHFMFFPMVAR